MQLGWISLHRQIQEHWIWNDKPFSYGQAWVDMLLLANHTDNKFLFGSELVTVSSGSFITSELKLMDRWGWSKSKVRRFLMLLENDSMIVKKTDRKKTTITIVKYSDYQESQTTKRPQKDRRKTTEKPQKDTNNNDNNDNNENNENNYVENPLLNEAIIAFVNYRKEMKKPMSENAIKLMIGKLNKLSPDVDEQIEIINQSIISGYQGVFPLKKGNEQQGKGRKEMVPDWMKKKTPRNSFNSYSDQREYDFDALEKELFANEKTVDNDPELAERAEALKKELQSKRKG